MKDKNVKDTWRLVKNPIGVIGLFLVLVEAIAAFVIIKSSLSYSLNLILVSFIVVFPFSVLLAFYMLVTRHHKKLYSPSDFKDEKNFVSTYNSATQTEELIEADSQEGIESLSAKEGMTVNDIKVIKESLNTIVTMQKSLTEKNKKTEEAAIVEHAEKTINERLESYVIEKERACTVSVSYIYGSREFVKDLNRKGYQAQIYFGTSGKSMLLDKNSANEAIWLGRDVPLNFALEIIKMAKTKFPHLKYIDLSPDYAPQYVHYQIYIGGATSTALQDGLRKLEISDFEKIYRCKSEEELHRCIADLNMN